MTKKKCAKFYICYITQLLFEKTNALVAQLVEQLICNQ